MLRIDRLIQRCALLVTSLVLVACSANTPSGGVTAVPPTLTPEPTRTPRPARMAAPSATPAPTDTRVPTITAAPTATAGPTIPPAPTAPPRSYQGAASERLAFDGLHPSTVLHTKGNACGQVFRILSVTPEGDDLMSLVNTKEPYDGMQWLNVDPLPLGREQRPAAGLDITADCAWQVEIVPFSSLAAVTAPGKVTGNGDSVIRLAGPIARAKITCTDLCVITGVGERDQYGTNLFLTDRAGEETVTVPTSAEGLNVRALGNWTVEIIAP